MEAHQKKIENVLRLDTQARCDCFVRKIADSEVVWGLFGIGWGIGTSDCYAVIPFWPEEDFAIACASKEWNGFHPKEIVLDEFLSR